MELGDLLPTENRYPDDPIDQSDDNNFGDNLPFSLENDDHPPSSPPSEHGVPLVSDHDTEHPSHTQRNPPVLPPQWCDDDAPRHGMRQQMVRSHPDSVMEQPFNNYFLFCPCLLLFGFVDDIIKSQQHESNFISFYLCLSLFGYLLSSISYLLSLISYLLIFLSLAHILLEDIWTISYWLISLG